MEQKLTQEELAAWLEFSTVPGLSVRAAVALLRAFGGPEGVLGASIADLKRAVPAEEARLFAGAPDEERAERIEATLAWASGTPGAFAVTLADADYPKGLLELAEPPFVLFGLGRRELLASRFVAILGGRRPTPEGALIAQEFGAGFEKAGLVLASAMMEGIDSESLRGALGSERPAAAVLAATPLDRVYPASGRGLMRAAAQKGVVLSPFLIGTPFAEENLGYRAHLLAALAEATVVMQAGPDSRALDGARIAAGMGRDVFAVPGSVREPLSKGPHRLIRGGARLAESVRDIANDLRPLSSPAVRIRDSGVF